MSSKIKFILIGILTIVMSIGIKFGTKSESYLIDVNIDKYYMQISKVLDKLEKDKLENIELVKLQDDINEARDILKDFQNYTIEKENDNYNETLTVFSLKIDKYQQYILNNIIFNITRAAQVRRVDLLEVAKNSILENLPQVFKEVFTEDINNIIIYEGLEEEAYDLADKAYLSVRKVANQNNVEFSNDIIQNNINEAKRNINELINYINNKEIDNYSDVLGEWSSTLDIIQQHILNDIDKAIGSAEESKKQEDIKLAKDKIPSELPGQWLKVYNDRLEKIK